MRPSRKKTKKKARGGRSPAPAAPSPSPAATPSPAMSKRRLWLLRILAAVVVPLLVLVLAEADLRLAGVGYPAGTVVACESDGRPASCSNLRFTRRFLPEALAPWLGPFVFPAEKPAGTYRIVVLGASAAQGDPQPLYGFWRILDVLLEARYPGVRFEVVNAAAVAVNSHVTRQSALDLARHEPDLFVLYLGNNEVVGPYGASSVAAPLQADLGVVRAGVWARTTLRVGILVKLRRVHEGYGTC